MSLILLQRKSAAIGIVFSLISILALNASGQTARNKAGNEDVYNSLLAFGITANTNSGIIGGAAVRYTKNIGTFLGNPHYQYLALEIVNVKNPKEYSLPTSGFNTTPNKLNYLFAIRPQYGREVFFFNRQDNEGLGLSGLIAVGPTIGIEKPYMINFQEGGRTVTIPYDPNLSGVYSSAGFLAGFGKSKIVPGLNAKAALNLEINAFRHNVTGLEVGFLVEAFTRKIELMAFPAGAPDGNVGNKSFFTSGYITLYFGNKK